MNILPDTISILFLIDSLRRLKVVSSGVMHIEIWQMILHIWSFVSVVVAGTLLSISTMHAWKKPTYFYATYESIVLMVFLCELPFIYIINKVVS